MTCKTQCDGEKVVLADYKKETRTFHWEVLPSEAWRKMCGDRNPALLMKIPAWWHVQCTLLGTSIKCTSREYEWEHMSHRTAPLPTSWQQRTPPNCRRGWLMAPKVLTERKRISHSGMGELKHDAQNKHPRTALRIFLSETMHTAYAYVSEAGVTVKAWCNPGSRKLTWYKLSKFFPNQLSCALSCQPTSWPVASCLPVRIYPFSLPQLHKSGAARSDLINKLDLLFFLPFL